MSTPATRLLTLLLLLQRRPNQKAAELAEQMWGRLQLVFSVPLMA